MLDEGQLLIPVASQDKRYHARRRFWRATATPAWGFSVAVIHLSRGNWNPAARPMPGARPKCGVVPSALDPIHAPDRTRSDSDEAARLRCSRGSTRRGRPRGVSILPSWRRVQRRRDIDPPCVPNDHAVLDEAHEMRPRNALLLEMARSRESEPSDQPEGALLFGASQGVSTREVGGDAQAPTSRNARIPSRGGKFFRRAAPGNSPPDEPARALYWAHGLVPTKTRMSAGRLIPVASSSPLRSARPPSRPQRGGTLRRSPAIGATRQPVSRHPRRDGNAARREHRAKQRERVEASRTRTSRSRRGTCCECSDSHWLPA